MVNFQKLYFGYTFNSFILFHLSYLQFLSCPQQPKFFLLDPKIIKLILITIAHTFNSYYRTRWKSASL